MWHMASASNKTKLIIYKFAHGRCINKRKYNWHVANTRKKGKIIIIVLAHIASATQRKINKGIKDVFGT